MILRLSAFILYPEQTLHFRTFGRKQYWCCKIIALFHSHVLVYILD